MEKELIQTGEFRAVRFFAGPAYQDLLKARFPAVRAGDDVFREAQERAGVERLLELHANVVICLFDAGFPPETAAGHHAAFAAFTGLLHEHGLLSIAAFTPSSCFRSGSFADKDWYALRPGGRRERCMATGRHLACWTSGDWRAHVDGLVGGAAERGADGFLFDRIAFGAVPGSAGGRWFGAAGCYCPRCRELFREFAAGRGRRLDGIPAADPESAEFRLYAGWRAGVVSDCLERWAGAARARVGGAVVLCGVDGLGQRNSYLEAGVAIGAVVAVSDVVVAENNNLSRFDRRGLTYDSTTFMSLCEYAGGERIANLPRFRGVGLDAVYPPGRFQIATAEAVAAGGLAHVQATEFRESGTGQFTVLTGRGCGKHREAVGTYLDWIEKNAEIYEGTEPAARIGVLHPEGEMRHRWDAVAPAFFKTLQTLTELHVLHRVVPESRAAEKLGGVGLLIVPPVAEYAEGLQNALVEFLIGGRVLFIGGPPSWAEGRDGVSSIPESIFAEPRGRFGFISALARGLAGALRLYEKASAERGRYHVPKRWRELFDTVRKIAGELPEDVLVEGPPSIHVHRRGRKGAEYFHIVNHMPGVERMSVVSLKFPGAVRARILTPDDPKIRYVRESQLVLKIGVYTVVEVKEGF